LMPKFQHPNRLLIAALTLPLPALAPINCQIGLSFKAAAPRTASEDFSGQLSEAPILRDVARIY
jgi:hypothetical protein